MKPRDWWKAIIDNIEKINGYDFSHLDDPKPVEKENCDRCEGRGYKVLPPGFYGMIPCTKCGGSGLQIKRKTNDNSK